MKYEIVNYLVNSDYVFYLTNMAHMNYRLAINKSGHPLQYVPAAREYLTFR